MELGRGKVKAFNEKEKAIKGVTEIHHFKRRRKTLRTYAMPAETDRGQSCSRKRSKVGRPFTSQHDFPKLLNENTLLMN